MSARMTAIQTEADRQIQICNACRYCEGYCSVFPSIFQERSFLAGDITQLANLCHNCRSCYYACQYIEPHEFALNLPAVLAEARSESWEHFAWPRDFARLFHKGGVAMSAALIVGTSFLVYLVSAFPSDEPTGFYRYLSHVMMLTIFAPAFLLPLGSIAIALKRYWRVVGGDRIRMVHLWAAMKSAGSMRNLAGGQGQGCNFENGDRYTNARRHAHQAITYGFLLCFASTASGTILHYVFELPAPYSPLSTPKLLGVPGGILLVGGTITYLWVKLKSDRALGDASAWGGEVAFTSLLGLTGLSGLALYWAGSTSLLPFLLAFHLGSVLTLFLTMPYSKMSHAFFRMAALVRDAQTG